MRWSRLHIPTLRETPAEAEVPSHRLLLRAGYIRPLAAGLYCHLFLAQRSLRKIVAIVREEMERIGAQEINLPALQPAELWRESGRWDTVGADLFRLRDRCQRELCLGVTHEEAVTALARGELRSYKQLPQIWYQIQTKFRDEPRPKSGLLRPRESLTKSSYSFDLDEAGLDASYRKHYDACRRIFDRCGLKYLIVEAGSGPMGPSQSHEFMVATDAGEDWVVQCPSCGYAANLEKAASAPKPPELADPAGDLAPESFHTPGRKTIADVAEVTGLPETSQMKSLVLVAGGSPVLALLRGDHQLSGTKFAAGLGVREFRPATAEEIREWFGADAGSLGPVGITRLRIVADEALRGRRNMICGANRDDYHLRHVTPEEDFRPEYFDLRQAAEGDACRSCGAALALLKTVAIGHISKLGSKYSEAMGLHVTDESGQEAPPVMGSYGIGIERILSAAIELHHDEDGMALPAPVAPFTVVVTPVNVNDAPQRETAEQIYRSCLEEGLDALLDDRDERPGVKFKDADLIGVPWRVVVGRKAAGGLVELVERRTREKRDIASGDVPAFLAERIGTDCER